MLVKHSNKKKGLLDRPKWYTEESYIEFLNEQNWWHNFLFPTLFTLTFVWNKSEKIKYAKKALKTIVTDKELVIRTVTFASKMGESTFPGALSSLSLWTLRETSLKLSFQRQFFSYIKSYFWKGENVSGFSLEMTRRIGRNKRAQATESSPRYILPFDRLIENLQIYVYNAQNQENCPFVVITVVALWENNVWLRITHTKEPWSAKVAM